METEKNPVVLNKLLISLEVFVRQLSEQLKQAQAKDKFQQQTLLEQQKQTRSAIRYTMNSIEQIVLQIGPTPLNGSGNTIKLMQFCEIFARNQQIFLSNFSIITALTKILADCSNDLQHFVNHDNRVMLLLCLNLLAFYGECYEDFEKKKTRCPDDFGQDSFNFLTNTTKIIYQMTKISEGQFNANIDTPIDILACSVSSPKPLNLSVLFSTVEIVLPEYQKLREGNKMDAKVVAEYMRLYGEVLRNCVAIFCQLNKSPRTEAFGSKVLACYPQPRNGDNRQILLNLNDVLCHAICGPEIYRTNMEFFAEIFRCWQRCLRPPRPQHYLFDISCVNTTWSFITNVFKTEKVSIRKFVA